MRNILMYILVLVVIGVMILLGYFVFSQSQAGAGTDSRNLEKIEVKTLFSKLNSFTWRTGVLTRTGFVNLFNFATPIERQDLGRSNPFAPIGADGGTLQPSQSVTSAAAPGTDTP